jgi:hypothetical protein
MVISELGVGFVVDLPPLLAISKKSPQMVTVKLEQDYFFVRVEALVTLVVSDSWICCCCWHGALVVCCSDLSMIAVQQILQEDCSVR